MGTTGTHTNETKRRELHAGSQGNLFLLCLLTIRMPRRHRRWWSALVFVILAGTYALVQIVLVRRVVSQRSHVYASSSFWDLPLSALRRSSLSSSKTTNQQTQENDEMNRATSHRILIAVVSTQRRLLELGAVGARTWAWTTTRRYCDRSDSTTCPAAQFSRRHADANQTTSTNTIIDVHYFVGTDKNDNDNDEALLTVGIRSVYRLPVPDSDAASIQRQAALIAALVQRERQESAAAAVPPHDWIYIVNEQVYIPPERLIHFVESLPMEDQAETAAIMYGAMPRPTTEQKRVARQAINTTNKSSISRPQAHQLASQPSFCWGGISAGGLLVSRQTVLQLAPQINACRVNIKQKHALWSDPVHFLSLCVLQELNGNCRSLPFLDDANKNYPSHVRWNLEQATAVAIGNLKSKARLVSLHEMLERTRMAKQQQQDSITTSTSAWPLPPWRNPLTPPIEFVFDESQLHVDRYGMRKGDAKKIFGQFRDAICHYHRPDDDDDGSQTNEENHAVAVKTSCDEDVTFFDTLQVHKCINCPASFHLGSWHTAVSPHGNLLARTDTKGRVLLQSAPSDHQFTQLDFLIPVRNESEKILRFVETLCESVQDMTSSAMGQEVKARLILSSHPDDTWLASGAYHRDVAQSSCVSSNLVEIVLAPCPSHDFHRSKASNCCLKQACREPDCVVTLIDVDMQVQSSYLFNVMSLVYPSATAYFPIVYSEFNPQTVNLANKALQRHEILRKASTWQNVDHKGIFRSFGYGMWAMTGLDAAGFRLSEEFQGWGGEDEAFYALITDHLNVIRMNEPGLVHKWHPKSCQVGSFVTEKRLLACQNSRDKVEGSVLGIYLGLQQQQR